MYPEVEFKECKKQKIYDLKCFLMATLPARIFDALCLERICCRYRGDPRIQLHVLIHPKMTVFRKVYVDNGISQHFWIKTVPWFSRLVVLDLRFACTDEILEIIASKCLLLEELNIVSRVDVCKSVINASVLIRNVSDVGLCCLRNLKQLRILWMDPPRNEKSSRVGRCVTQTGIIMLLRELPYLEELNIESCDIGSTLIGAGVGIGPLSLRKANCHCASAEGIRKLIKICPHLKELSVTHLSANDKESILEEITASELRLSVLNMSFFSYTESLQRLLQVQGRYLTHFSLWDIDQSVNIDAVVHIGLYCPNLVSLCLMTQSNNLFIPPFFRRPDNIFSELRSLTLGNENFKLEDMILFFLELTTKMSKLVLKYQTKLVVDELLLYVLKKGYLSNISNLWLDITLEVSKDVVTQIIQSCDKLTNLTVDLVANDVIQILQYIHKNNLDLRFDVHGEFRN
ncbi:jg24497 [Pararge aegeria aegeria]|uniref:Jg24497 protein n=1 Tax=Pararge aegeria aegeria TaxID=348720 RepID=A0A8S4RFP0_9NEOP|nr:jg24497 [Pararge aegeria aegeria]